MPCVSLVTGEIHQCVPVPQLGKKLDWSGSRASVSSQKIWNCSGAVLSTTVPYPRTIDLILDGNSRIQGYIFFNSGLATASFKPLGRTLERRDRFMMSTRGCHIPSPLACTSYDGHWCSREMVGLTSPRILLTLDRESWFNWLNTGPEVEIWIRISSVLVQYSTHCTVLVFLGPYDPRAAGTGGWYKK